MSFEKLNPASLGRPRGWTHGMLAPAGGRVLFIAGMTAPEAGDFLAQWDAVLTSVLTVLREAGGAPEHVGRMTVFVTDMAAYRGALKALGPVWQRHMGDHYPAMALVQVAALVDPGAQVEIETTAVLPA